MQNISLQFYKGKELLYECMPHDVNTRRTSQGFPLMDKAEKYNFEPKKFETLNFMIGILEEDIMKIEGTTIIKIQYFNKKNKPTKRIIHKGTIKIPYVNADKKVS